MDKKIDLQHPSLHPKSQPTHSQNLYSYDETSEDNYGYEIQEYRYTDEPTYYSIPENFWHNRRPQNIQSTERQDYHFNDPSMRQNRCQNHDSPAYYQIPKKFIYNIRPNRQATEGSNINRVQENELLSGHYYSGVYFTEPEDQYSTSGYHLRRQHRNHIEEFDNDPNVQLQYETRLENYTEQDNRSRLHHTYGKDTLYSTPQSQGNHVSPSSKTVPYNIREQQLELVQYSECDLQIPKTLDQISIGDSFFKSLKFINQRDGASLKDIKKFMVLLDNVDIDVNKIAIKKFVKDAITLGYLIMKDKKYVKTNRRRRRVRQQVSTCQVIKVNNVANGQSTQVAQNKTLEELITDTETENGENTAIENEEYTEIEKGEYAEENREYAEEYREYAEENREYAEENREYAEENREYAEENREYAEENREYAEENREYAEENRDVENEKKEHRSRVKNTGRETDGNEPEASNCCIM